MILDVRTHCVRLSLIIRLAEITLILLLVLALLAWRDENQRKLLFGWEITEFDADTDVEASAVDDEPPDLNAPDDSCNALRGAEDVVVTVKTGASEASHKIPIQMSTNLRCAPNVFIFSDMEQDIGDYHLYDALDTISRATKEGNEDFDLYRHQQQLKAAGQDVTALHDVKDAAWSLDKYKNTHIVEKSFALEPNKNWYLHIDADTYIVWSSLLPWLEELDASNHLYAGSITCFGTGTAAHGGSGILLSGATMHLFAFEHNDTAASWDPKVHDNCCGDSILGQALNAYGINVTNAWPIFDGFTPATVPFGADHWCQPLVTLHHMSPFEMEEMHSFEERRLNGNNPLLYSELYKDLVAEMIPDSRKGWDSMPIGETISDIGSAKACEKACRNNPQCFQTSYDGDNCILGTDSFRLGENRTTDGKRWQSSWNKTRISEWIAAQYPCGEAKFGFRYDRACTG
ncbi:hypothetical protein NA57DRAFT_50799 [Rhizodiscina lignyota]|uniref:Glycosyltransferase family 31 protein n=1 Tax=Rhizodiscina lignyota TaxID=1504668 RepID=A0A9P4IRA8_9PEZI|nr:hypothetical protein NA57DRAFT_50799 [Rhizodiscina lignyota]